MTELYPLRFRSIYRQYIWGGRRLATVLGKDIPAECDDFAESWEIVDHGKDQSSVAYGPLAGKTLHELVCHLGESLLGRHSHLRQFPLLFKFLDANKMLSVQVHPNDEQASQLDPPDLGKTEAWLILAAEPGSCLYAGLRDGITRSDFLNALRRGTVEECLNRIEPHVGDCIFIPAGTVHALGSGLVVAEIQQASDTTFRLFDWNRLDANGNPRALHIEQGLAVTDFSRGAVTPQVLSKEGNGETLVECDKFIMRRHSVQKSIAVGGDDRCHIIVVVDGSVEVEGDLASRDLSFGQTMLIPAGVGETKAVAGRLGARVLDIYIP